MTIREIMPNSREDTCKNCPELDVNYNSDESYCNLADGEEIRLKRGQHRPEWCPKRVWKSDLKARKVGEVGMRLIDADALADALFEKRKSYPQWVADVIGNMPDAVVRCKDCKHGGCRTQKLDGSIFRVVCKKHGTKKNELWMDADWFCADGIRKE